MFAANNLTKFYKNWQTILVVLAFCSFGYILSGWRWESLATPQRLADNSELHSAVNSAMRASHLKNLVQNEMARLPLNATTARSVTHNVTTFPTTTATTTITTVTDTIREATLPSTILSKFINNNERNCRNVSDNLGLVGALNMTIMSMENQLNMSYVQEALANVTQGHWSPTNCQPIHKIALIIPFRDRFSHLTLFLAHTLPLLQRQAIEFYVIVVEQEGTGTFNKGRLFNAAFRYAEENFNVSCVVLHDVDLFPENDRIFYGCPQLPLHLGAYVDTLSYSLMYYRMVGGVLSMTTAHYRLVNGYSNEYWGWGGEDDDMGIRLQNKYLPILRPDQSYTRFKMLRHKSRYPDANPKRFKLIEQATARQITDGVAQPVWKVVEIKVKQLYHHLMVNVGEKPANR